MPPPLKTDHFGMFSTLKQRVLDAFFRFNKHRLACSRPLPACADPSTTLFADALVVYVEVFIGTMQRREAMWQPIFA